LAGWEGSAHDALILADALQRTNGLKVPQGKYIVGHHMNSSNQNTMMSSDPTYLTFVRKILLGRCWVYLQTWISATIQSH
jgi:hypothetical protein